MKQVSKNSRSDGGPNQAIRLEDLNSARTQAFAFGIEQAIIGTTEAIGLQSSLQGIRLEQNGEASERALLDRSGG